VPSLTPVSESSESLAPLAEGSETLASLAEGAETLTALSELTNEDTPAVPGTYPSAADTFPSAAATWPSVGTALIPGVGLTVAALSEGSLDLTVLQEA
jgi:hypothetical protein